MSNWSDSKTATPLADFLGARRGMQESVKRQREHALANAMEMKAHLDAMPRAEIEAMLAACREHQNTMLGMLGIETLTQYLRDGTVPNL